MNFSWMAWTLPTTLFFLTILALLIAMSVWEYFSPGGSRARACCVSRRRGATGFFISLLGSAFIHLAWLGLGGPNLWWALAISVVYAIGVFRYVEGKEKTDGRGYWPPET
ncbi:hypothetical protein GYN07_31080 (plasmid) [Rhizobium leguminosarum bv. viciae 248]|uniref:DUF2160 domain-containing protein n=1 Tax=Rhizobium leguminosarum TaxID=384 RepID=UPI001397B1C6|nr:DUF2160 family membrane protein [Rhizobium leguminosarum]QHW28770.1 hypothetical protein GYN07_31080 [Rhizobium leguminosarum bv. viciae 248]